MFIYICHFFPNNPAIRFFIMLILMSQFLFAQGSGSIRGTIIEKGTNDPLAGANIIVKNTNMGAASDIEGNFFIPQVPAGQQQLVISYIGYNAVTVDITIAANQTVNVEYELVPEVLEGEEVIITAQAKGQLQAINQQLQSTGITSMVSAERIREVPDANAAESVGRLPGISLKRSSGEGNEIVVRGIQPRFNLVTVNGISMPSTNESNTAVGLAGISQYMLSGIEVRKSLRAEDDANVVGGIVDLKLATAPEGLQGDAILEGMYNGLTDNYGSYRSSLNLSNRFFDSKLGVIGQLNLEEADRTNDALSAGYNRDTRTVNNRGVFLTNGNFQRNDITRDRFGATILLDYKLSKGKIQLNSIYNNLDEDRWERNDIYNVAAGQLGANKNMRSVNDENYTLINNLSLETELFEVATFDIGAALTSGRREGYTNAMSFNYDIALPVPIVRSFHENTYGKTAYDLVPNIIDTGSTANNYKISRMFKEDRNFKESEGTFQANLKVPFILNNKLSGFVKVGGKLRLKDRDYDYSYDGDAGGIYGGDSDILIEILNDNPEINWPFSWSNRPDNKNELPAYPLFETGNVTVLDDKFGIKDFAQRKWVDQIVNRAKASNWANLPQWFQTVSHDLANDYNGDEKLYAGYLMTEFNWGNLISLNAGLRYENEETNYSGYGVVDILSSVNDIIDTLSDVKRTNEYFLPSATLRFNYTEWGDIRIAYSKSLARPEYYAFIPHYSADIRNSLSGTTQASYFSAAAGGAAGNIHLEPAVSNNLDLIFSFYGNYIGLFTVSGFYKEIDKYFYQSNFEVIDAAIDNQILRDNNYNFTVPKTQFINIWRNLDNTSYIRGAEVDWQTNFWYLPFPLNGLVLQVNYTKLSSKATYYTPRKVQTFNNRGQVIAEARIDSFQTQSLVDQPNDIFNASIGYDYKDFSMRVAYNFQGKTLSFKTNYVESDGFTHDYSRLDLSVRQKLPLWGLSVQLLLSNITEEADMSYTYTRKYNNNEQYYGMTASLGLRYEFR